VQVWGYTGCFDTNDELWRSNLQSRRRVEAAGYSSGEQHVWHDGKVGEGQLQLQEGWNSPALIQTGIALCSGIERAIPQQS
jgi:hypothetical protein